MNNYDVTYSRTGSREQKTERTRAKGFNDVTGQALERCAELKTETGSEWRIGRIDPR